MGKYKFKFGDRIRVVKLRKIHHSKDTIKVGMLGTVIENGSDRPWIEFDENINGYNSYKGSAINRTMCMWEDEIEKVEAQFTKSNLKDGDIVTYRNGEKRTVINNKLIDEDGEDANELSYYKKDLTEEDETGYLDIIKVERPIGYETIFERKEEILDETEKRYLRDVIRPFRDKVTGIIKNDSSSREYQYIELSLKCDDATLPYFEADTMYKNMKVNKSYTLKELGL